MRVEFFRVGNAFVADGNAPLPVTYSEASKRVGGQKGLRRGDQSYANDSGLFPAHFFY